MSETKGHSKTCSETPLSHRPFFPLQPWFQLLFPFCVCKDKIPYYMSWPYSQHLNSSLPLTLLGTVICSVDCYCSDCDQGHLF